jgi:hypothetical protein
VAAGRRVWAGVPVRAVRGQEQRHQLLSLNGADNGLHLVSAVAGVAIALWPADRTVPRQGGVTERST